MAIFLLEGFGFGVGTGVSLVKRGIAHRGMVVEIDKRKEHGDYRHNGYGVHSPKGGPPLVRPPNAAFNREIPVPSFRP
jgi:hypothetical protein